MPCRTGSPPGRVLRSGSAPGRGPRMSIREAFSDAQDLVAGAGGHCGRDPRVVRGVSDQRVGAPGPLVALNKPLRHSTTFKSIMQTLCYMFTTLVEALKRS